MKSRKIRGKARVTTDAYTDTIKEEVAVLTSIVDSSLWSHHRDESTDRHAQAEPVLLLEKNPWSRAESALMFRALGTGFFTKKYAILAVLLPILAVLV